MAVTQYIGARYVPLFADPAEWDSTREYEPLTVVLYQGASYTSRQAVPIGIDISNDSFWVRTADYNAQVNQYRQEVQTFDGRITANATAISDEVSARETAISDEASARTTADAALDARVTANETAISDEVLARTNADTSLDTRITANENAISDEVSARETAYTTLDGKIDTEIATESAARIAEDTSLSDRIDAIEQGGGADFDAIVKRLDMMQLKTGNMVVFGDSYSQPNIENSVNAHWCHRVANAYGLDLFNFAVAGAGWGRTNALISAQQTTCQNTMTAEQKQDTSLVIAYAGCNDLLNSIAYAAVSTGINNFIDWAVEQFPNAAIMVVPFNFGFGGLTYQYYNTIYNTFSVVMRHAPQPRVRIVHYAWMWVFGWSNMCQNQNHPNETGYNAIAGYMIQAMHGIEDVMGVASHLSFNSGNLDHIEINYAVTNDTVNISGFLHSSVAGNQANTVLANSSVGYGAISKTSLHIVPLYSVGQRTVCGELRFMADGAINCNLNASYVANDNVYFETSFKAQNGMAWHA